MQAGSLLGRSQGQRGGSARSHRLAAIAALREAAALRAKRGKLIAAAEIISLAAAVHLEQFGKTQLDRAAALLDEAANYRARGQQQTTGLARANMATQEPALSEADAKKIQSLTQLIAGVLEKTPET